MIRFLYIMHLKYIIDALVYHVIANVIIGIPVSRPVIDSLGLYGDQIRVSPFTDSLKASILGN